MLPGLADILGGIRAIFGQKRYTPGSRLKGQHAPRSPTSLSSGRVIFFVCFFFFYAFALAQMLIPSPRDQWAIIGNVIGLNN